MKRIWPNYSKLSSPLLLIAERDPLGSQSASRKLQQQNVKLAVARSVSEAKEMIQDLQFIGASIDGLITDLDFVDGNGGSIVRELRDVYPQTPVAILAGECETNVAIWTHLRGVDVLRRTPHWEELHDWLVQLQVSA